MKKIGLLSLAATTVIMASGWKIPEQSVNATALAGADVANVHGADAAYSNPANMAFMDQGSYVEADLTYIHLTSIDYDGNIAALAPDTGNTGVPNPTRVDASASSKKENFVLPMLHYVGKAYGDYRFGMSLTVPAGLSKRWEEGGASTLIAKEFSLQVIEFNPVVSYKATDSLAFAAGLRFVHSKGIVKSSGVTVADLTAAGGSAGDVISLNRDMQGDDLSMGYNFALSYKPVKEMTLAATYRSKVDLYEKGDATLSSNVVQGFGAIPNGTSLGAYNGDASVTIPLPAILTLATAYTFNESTTVELVYERAYWSAYSSLDFEYPGGSTGSSVLDSAFNDPKVRNWEDSNTYRLGLTHKFNKKWTGMAGYAYDESPSPQSTVSFELPESDAQIFSLGARYNYDDALSIGIAGLYDKKDSITVSQPTRLNGTFSNASAYLLTIGVGYKY